ncbi:hypothetical protein AX17_004789 [Amanita inopinata Kibby_2008]|nr:hypothetical protein AX17_004789 [Amanita inopinata Kibby_2008]
MAAQASTMARKAPMRLEIVVVGAGIAGIATAYALRKVGHNVIVLEKGNGLIKGHGSIRSPPNMTRILYEWGLEPLLKEKAHVSNKIKLYEGETAELLGAIVLHENFLRQMFLLDMIIMQHGELLVLLYDLACKEGVEFRFGSKVTNVIGFDGVNGSHSSVVLTEEAQLRCDLVVGADGPSGVVRSSVTGQRSDDIPVTDVSLLFSLPMDEIRDDDELKSMADTDWNVWLGGGYRLSTTTMNNGRELDVAINYSLEKYAAPPSLSELDCGEQYSLDRFQLEIDKFHPILQKLLVKAKQIRPIKYFAQPSLDAFICEEPRIVLVGEAAHPLMPAGLHNTGLGVEDAQLLAALFSKVQSYGHLSQLLIAFDDIRQSRCVFAQEWDLTKYKLFTLPPGSEQEARNNKFKEAFSNREWENLDGAALQQVWHDEFALFSYDAGGRLDFIALYDASIHDNCPYFEDHIHGHHLLMSSPPSSSSSSSPAAISSSTVPAASPTAATTSYALTSLLDSLHTHLQQQTQLLPTLHAQLGLPPTAIADELKSLQQQLVEGIERQIDTRRKEVDHWVEKCELVENECIRYSKALGRNTKVTGVSVGELRKEMILPRRYQMATTHQEKLRQLYHTKLEQLNTLTNRINTLVRTLGSDYFARDITEPTFANGEAHNDAKSNRDVTPERFLKLEKELVRGKAEVAKRLNQLCATFVHIDWLYTELGMEPPDPDEVLSPGSLEFAPSTSTGHNPVALTSSTLSTNALNDPFLEVTPTPASRSRPRTPLLFQAHEQLTSESECQRIFATFVTRLEEADDETVNKVQGLVLNPRRDQRQSHGHSSQSLMTPFGLDGVDPTPSLLSWAENLKTSLEDTKKRREAHIQAMYDQLEGLWRRLGVNEEDMDGFVETHRGSTEETIRQYEEELEGMLELKRERMGAFVASAREEIERLWDELMVGDEERGCFAPFADDEHTEELLTIHEDEIRRLKEERRAKAPLLASIKKYFEICGEEKELAAAASDQSRLLGRGARDPGRLLREEKMRKRVSKEKPRLEQDLLASIPAWEQEIGRPFLVHGESILQILTDSVSTQDQENANRRNKFGSRAGSVPPRATTPLGSSAPHGYVPGTKTGVVTPAVRSAGSMGSQSVPNKRQRVGESHSGGYVNSGTAHVQRAPLGTYRGGNMTVTGMGRPNSPTKIPAKTPGGSGSHSALPRPVVVPIAMPIPKPGTQHHALGHGRLPHSNPTAVPAYAARSSSTSGLNYGRYTSGPDTAVARASTGRKSLRAKRESFKPRPSIDGLPPPVDLRASHAAGRWTGGYRSTTSVKEEVEEGY